MKIAQLVEEQRAAVMAFGRMNPPTIGHKKLVDTVKGLPGDPYIFLSQSQKPKTDPLPFQEKLRYAKFFFPDVTIGNPQVKTIIQALQKINELGYTDLIYVAGSDRVESFQELINKYNGVEYNFNSIKVVSAGERDPDADGAEGMSASKMRAAAASGDFDSFAQGVPNQEVADEMFAAVRAGMGIKDKEAVPAEGVAEGVFGLSAKEKGKIQYVTAKISDIPGNWDHKNQSYTEQGLKDLKSVMKNEKYLKYALSLTADDYEAESKTHISPSGVKTVMDPSDDDYDINYGKNGLVAKFRKSKGLDVKTGSKKVEASYEGNIGIMELFKFFAKAEKEDPKLVARVKEMIKQRQDKEVWKIVQDYTGDKLVGQQFEGTIYSTIMKEANYGKYWCSTDKKWKYRKGPKQSRSS